MHEPVSCTCGLCVGHLIPLYVAMKDELYRSAYGEDLPDPVFMNLLETSVELNDVFVALEVNVMCCRRTMMTYAPMRDYY